MKSTWERHVKNAKDENHVKSTHERKFNTGTLQNPRRSRKTKIKIFEKIYVVEPREILQNNVTTWECHVKVKMK